MPSQLPESFVDVLVIGAGPAGLMCAHALAAAGDIKVKIIDQRCVQFDQAADKIMLRHLDLRKLLLVRLMGSNQGQSKYFK